MSADEKETVALYTVSQLDSTLTSIYKEYSKCSFQALLKNRKKKLSKNFFSNLKQKKKTGGSSVLPPKGQHIFICSPSYTHTSVSLCSIRVIDPHKWPPIHKHKGQANDISTVDHNYLSKDLKITPSCLKLNVMFLRLASVSAQGYLHCKK